MSWLDESLVVEIAGVFWDLISFLRRRRDDKWLKKRMPGLLNGQVLHTGKASDYERAERLVSRNMLKRFHGPGIYILPGSTNAKTR
jgi:hypothetical protein